MPRQPLKPRTEPPYRIKDLVEQTGVSREAIRFYINEGLLPPAEKSARNMARYSQQRLDLLRQVKRLQRDHFLSLKAIRMVLGGGRDPDDTFSASQIASLQRIRQRLNATQGRLPMSAPPAELARDFGLSRLERKELRDLGVAASGVATISDVEIVRLWIALRDAGMALERGFSPRDIHFVLEAARHVLDHELEIFRDRMKTLSTDELIAIIDTAIPAVSKLFVTMHERAVYQFIDDYLGRSAQVNGRGSDSEAPTDTGRLQVEQSGHPGS